MKTKNPDEFTKEEAAEYLGRSVRSIENYTKQRRVSVRYVPGKTSPVAIYAKEDLDKLKAELETPIHAPAIERENAISQKVTKPEEQSTQLATIPPTGQGIALITQLAQAIVEATGQAKTKPQVSIESKPLLKLDEASALTGLSRQVLREAIRSKKLKARLESRAFRIRREELDTYIRNNF